MSEPYWIPLGAGPPPPPSGSVIARSAADFDIINTIAETTLFSFTVPGNALGTDKVIVVDLRGDWLHNTADNGPQIRLKYGSQKPVDFAHILHANLAGRVPFKFDIVLASKGLSAQWVHLQEFTIKGQSSGVPVAGIGGSADGGGGDGGQRSQVAGDATVDSTIDQLFAVTIQWPVASVLNSYRRRYVTATLL